MCGFFSYLGNDHSMTDLIPYAEKIQYRGPDNSKYDKPDSNLFFIFHRLSIIGLSGDGDQPLYHPNDSRISLICNGEIYNYKELIDKYDFITESSSDCEVILHMYKRFGIERTLKELDGVFAFSLYDKATKVLYSARDPFGVRPSFFGVDDNGGVYISSEAKAIVGLAADIRPFPPATWWSSESPLSFNKYYHYRYYKSKSNAEEKICSNVNRLLSEAVRKRMMSDREVGCLLSGGLDSSLIAALVQRHAKENNDSIKTFSIGMPGSPDLKYAKKVADWIDSDHYHIEIDPQDFLDAIDTVIYNIESFDTTTVRASVGNYLVSKYIKDNTDCKVIFNGDGSDEVCCGYVYNKDAPSRKSLQNEALRLLKEIHLFDALRSDRSISSNGLEARTPFLDKDFVRYYMSIPPELKEFDKVNRMEKYILRKAFEHEALLPPDVLWRHKCAFSDGVSSSENSWHTVLQNFVNTKITDQEFRREAKKITHCTPLLKESLYYRKIYESFFGRHTSLIPHFWMPKWTDVIDPSARELSGYTE